MFTHILLPTDGSELSNAAIQQGIQFARSLNARVTGLHVIAPYSSLYIGERIFDESESQYAADAAQQAEHYLGVIDRAARDAGVPCEILSVNAKHAYEAIIQTAVAQGCDCIVMASHGRKGVQGLLMGSETAKVLTHTKLPVLVLH
jgi:nucleotide-binding universal stress UspA family protein